MKIGILTFHRSINYGAVMQCYSLATELQRRFPNDTVEVIDYVPQFRLDKYSPTYKQQIFGSLSENCSTFVKAKIIAERVFRSIRNPAYMQLIKTRYNAFQRSMNILPLSEHSYRQNKEIDFWREVKGKYDVIVVGSDCVWEWSSVPFPNAYYLTGEYRAYKLSFAASAGTDNYYELPEEKQVALGKAISDFYYVGIRDTSTEYVVHHAAPQIHFHHNCDPTTFFDAARLNAIRDKVRERLRLQNITFDKPVIGIMGNENLGKLAHDIFDDEVQYVGVYVPNQYCDVQLLDLTVLEWASIFGLFHLTFTTFFHGTMLSLANHTPVLSFDSLPETELQHTKLHELYDRLDLPGFYHRFKKEYVGNEFETIKQSAMQFMKTPPKEEIRQELEKESKYCESFFEALEQLKEEIGFIKT